MGELVDKVERLENIVLELGKRLQEETDKLEELKTEFHMHKSMLDEEGAHRF